MAYPNVDQLPPAPQRGEDFEKFTAKASAHVAALHPWTDQVNTLAEWMDDKGEEVEANATAADESAALSEDWAVQTGTLVDATDYSSKEWAQGDTADSAKRWAISTTEVDGGLKGARSYASDASASASSAATDANRAESAVATLPEGTINDSVVAPDMAWSSSKIDARLNADRDPTISFDFARGEYYVDDGERTFAPAEWAMTVERATPKWVMGPNGKLREVAPNTIARKWDPVTGEPLGALIEESRTNLLKWSETDGTNWPVASSATHWANTPVVKRGVTLDKYTRGDLSLTDVASNSPTATWSVFFYDGGEDADNRVIRGELNGGATANTSGNLFFDYSAKTFSLDPGNGTWEFEAESLGDDLYYVTLTGQTVTGEVPTELRTAIYGANKWLGGFQLEEGPASSSYIPTTDSPVTRAADSVSRELGDEATGGEFTVYARGTQIANSGTYFSITGPRGYSENGVRVGVPTNGDRSMWSSVSGPTNLPPFPDANPGGFNKVAVTVTKDDVFVSINGAVDRKSRNKNTLVLDTLNIGQLSGNNNNMNGPLSEIIYYPYAMTETELQELTANG